VLGGDQTAGCVALEWVGGGLGIDVGRGLSSSTVAVVGVGIRVVVCRRHRRWWWVMTWRWALGSTSSSSGLLGLVDVSDVAMGVECCDPGGCRRGAKARRRRGCGDGRVTWRWASDVAMGGRWELGTRCRGCWGSSTSVTWQLRPVRFGVQAARGGVMGGVTHLGCTQWVLVVVVGGDGGGWW